MLLKIFQNHEKQIKAIKQILTKASIEEADLTKRSISIYAIAAWMAINILLFIVILLSGDVEDLNNYIEIALWIAAIPSVLSMKKAGLAFATFVLIYTLSTSMGILIYYQVWLNALRVIINAAATIYLFRLMLQSKNM